MSSPDNFFIGALFWGYVQGIFVQLLLRLLVVLLVISLRRFLWGTTVHPPAFRRYIFLLKRSSREARDYAEILIL